MVRNMKAGALLAVLGCAAFAAFWWRGSARSARPESGRVAGSEETVPTTRTTSPVTRTEIESRPGEVARSSTTTEPRRNKSTFEPASDPVVSGVTWPVRRGARTVKRAAADSEEPLVPVALAFRALNFVGVDPEAEKTWLKAINDPRMPEGVRSDLIEDLNDEGYTDNNRPTKKDLPLIQARLVLIERLSPLAMDDVNAAAFEEAYKDLLNMYVRLGGKPRGKR